jgi:hypothetical protein
MSNQAEEEPNNRKQLTINENTSKNQKLKTLILVVVIASLVWGFVGSVDLFIISGLQSLFPTRTKLQYSIMQIAIYLLLIMLMIYITDFDASSLFISSNHFDLKKQV